VGAIHFGISHAHGGTRLGESARLLAAALEGQLDQPVEPLFNDDYEQLLEGVKAARLDLAWMPPLLQARALQAGATLAAVSERGGTLVYRSALLVRDDDGARRVLADLRGARAAWSDPHSAAGHLFPMQLLRREKVELAAQEFYGSSLGALGALKLGRADVCACYVSEASAADHTMALAMADVQRSFGAAADGLRVLAVTAPIPPDGIVLAPGVDGAQRARLKEALLHLHEAPAGRAALGVLMGVDRLAPVTDAVTLLVATLRAD
jgi:ABC-type phosphate/phosphonate transport system substrate-binding protein